MFKIYNKILTEAKILAHNFMNDTREKRYPKTQPWFEDEVVITPEELKQVRINILLYIKQCKNTFYKYTQKEKFNEELYKKFIDEDHFDGGDTGFDDEDNVRIFDKYVLDYIKSRNEILTFFQCKNITLNLKHHLNDLRDFRSSEQEKDILFVMDMPEKEIFEYCYDMKKNIKDCNVTKGIILSMVFKMNNEYVNIKLNASKNTEHHHRMILESCL